MVVASIYEKIPSVLIRVSVTMDSSYMKTNMIAKKEAAPITSPPLTEISSVLTIQMLTQVARTVLGFSLPRLGIVSNFSSTNLN